MRCSRIAGRRPRRSYAPSSLHRTSVHRRVQRYIANARYEAGPNFGEPLGPLPPELIAASGGDVIDRVITTEPARISQCGRVVTVEAPGIEPGSENSTPSASTCVASLLIRPDLRRLTGSPRASHLFDLTSAPVTRASASQLADGLPWALTGPSVDRPSGLLIRQRERLRCRSQLFFPRVFTWTHETHGTQQDGRNLRRSRSPPWR